MSVKKHPSSWVGCFFMLLVKRLKTQSRFALIIFLPEAFIFAPDEMSGFPLCSNLKQIPKEAVPLMQHFQ